MPTLSGEFVDNQICAGNCGDRAPCAGSGKVFQSEILRDQAAADPRRKLQKYILKDQLPILNCKCQRAKM